MATGDGGHEKTFISLWKETLISWRLSFLCQMSPVLKIISSIEQDILSRRV